MGSGGLLRRLRWPGMVGVGSGHAPGGRLIPVFERELWRPDAGPSHVVFVCVAAYLQRATLDSFRMPGGLAVCNVSLAGAGPYLSRQDILTRCADARRIPPAG